MLDIGWQFPALLFLAMVVSGLLTLLQQRQYSRELTRVAEASRGSDDVLLSGRGRSIRGGAVLILVVDRANGRITTARGMVGASVFARFRDLPALLGPTATVSERTRGKQLSAAVTMALAQMPTPRRPRATAPKTTFMGSRSTVRPARRPVATA
ncbi:transcriptional regulator GutM [Brachybacterium sp. FME24]|uniref:transcriptional regulator GutM n=1 Tax=Brachybacterium sp. FME24 TaxID=2742605 RepID=UPI0018673F88|nr:transcriptional regulator GutM [Brachybacterium sp. FME24]